MTELILGHTLEIVDMLADLMEHLAKTDIGEALFNDFLKSHKKHQILFNKLVKIGEKSE